ncbi:hypothetical protein PR002_g4642 [Phytophthora rubi]|uniref:BTB domain-containing protein n=1 Tax=Phytophthora rubi TaxID=129364 RepID=A0A6A3NCD4_9STRA|nr:hypothetical protein PR002_g4642 [Phytophthora rubi]
MTLRQWTEELDELLLDVTGRFATWSERVRAFVNVLERREFTRGPDPPFTAEEMQSHFKELCERIPIQIPTNRSVSWNAKRTELLLTIHRNTEGESYEVKTVLFNQAIKEKGWTFSASLEQVKKKLQATADVAGRDVLDESNKEDFSLSMDEFSSLESETENDGGSCVNTAARGRNDAAITSSVVGISDHSTATKCTSDPTATTPPHCDDQGSSDELSSDETSDGTQEQETAFEAQVAGLTSQNEMGGGVRVDDLQQAKVDVVDAGVSGVDSMATHLHSLVNTKLMSDVTFIVFAHRCICLRSSYFKTILAEEIVKNNAGRVEISGVSKRIFLSVLAYIYTDSVDIPEDKVMEMFTTANRYGIETLKQLCSQRLLKSVGIDNVADMLLLAVEHGDVSLQDECFAYTLRNLEAVSKTKSFQEMAHRNPNMMDNRSNGIVSAQEISYTHLPIAEQQKKIKIRSAYMMFLGTALVLLFSDPMVDVLSEVGARTGIPAFYVSFVVAPLASNASELIAAYNYAQKKTSKTISISVSALLGAACMNNTFCLGIFAALMSFKSGGLVWEFSAETLSILLVELAIGYIAMKKTQRLIDGLIVLMLYPTSIFLVFLLENVLGLD